MCHLPQELGVSQNTYRELATREGDLQKQLIKMSEENIELRFGVEQANKDIPRLKVILLLTAPVQVSHKEEITL